MKLQFHNLSRRATLLEKVTVAGIEIPEGFIYNGANIPIWAIILVWLTRWHPKIRRAALVHDYLYSIGEKRLADKLFKKVMIEDGCNRWQTYLCYKAVKYCGYADPKDLTGAAE